ncbi:MAG: DUF177 domain-containing protein [Verrucomicrobia bacterium]|nr:DUF177 domain-containing protein [Verrucomicrobiota bacterium]
MPLLLNLLTLSERNVALSGQLAPEEVGLVGLDELVHAREPLEYDFEASQMDDAILVQGSWRMRITFECGRCLKPFTLDFGHEDWACHLQLKGEDAVPVVNEAVDLTLPLREDILLALPSHPVCDEDCAGLPKSRSETEKERAARPELSSGAWTALDKLKL